MEVDVQEPAASSTNTPEDSGGTYKSRQLAEEDLKRLGVVLGANGLYYLASDELVGAITSTPVDPVAAHQQLDLR